MLEKSNGYCYLLATKFTHYVINDFLDLNEVIFCYIFKCLNVIEMTLSEQKKKKPLCTNC